MGKTHIEITESVRDDLRVWKAKRGMTYDTALAALLNGVDENYCLEKEQ